MSLAHTTSLQICMDPSDHWLQGTMSEEISTGLDSSLSSPSGGTTECMLAAACSSRAGPQLMERRLRPPHDQNLKCPRCDSSHTKFCYYNNYSLSQPRYFCKTCRRYWTKGGTLRNIPVGGGCRKNKKSSKKSSDLNHHQNHHQSMTMSQGGSNGGGLVTNSTNPTDLHLSFPEVQFPPHLANLIGAQMSGLGGGSFLEGGLLRPIDFMESKYEGLVSGNGNGNRGHDFMGGNNNNNGDEFGVINGIVGDNHHNIGGYNGITNGFSGINLSSFGHNNDHIGNNNSNNSGISFMDQRLLLPYDGSNNNHHHHNNNIVDVKPNPKLLSLEWQDQGCNSDAGKDTTSFGGYNVNATLSSWSGMMAGFQPSTTNSLV